MHTGRVMIGGWLVDTITVQSYSGRTKYGDPLYGPQFEVRARVEASTQLVRGIDGEERSSTHSIATETILRHKDRVWIPGKDTSNPDDSLSPIAISTASRKSGNGRFYMVFL